MSTAIVGKIQVRNGPTSDRLPVVLDVAEIGYDTSLKNLFLGDGSTAGGIPVIQSNTIVYSEWKAATFSEQTTTTNLTIPQLTVTFIAPIEPVVVEWGGAILISGGTPTAVTLAVMLDGVEFSKIIVREPEYTTGYRAARLTLTPGQTYTITVVMTALGTGSTARIFSNPADYPSITVRRG